MSLDVVKSRIQKLLALAAPGSGATEPERETARRLAERLMQAHGLSEKDIPKPQVERPQPRPAPVYQPGFVVVVNIGGFTSSNSTTGASGFGWGFDFGGMNNEQS